MANVASMEPTLLIDGDGSRLRLVEVPEHHLWTPDPDFAVFVNSQVMTRVGIDNPHLGMRNGHSTGPRPEPSRGSRTGDRAGLSEPVSLHNLDIEGVAASSASSALSGAAPENKIRNDDRS